MMSTINKKLVGVLALMLLVLTAGCTTRSILRFEDHPLQNKTYVETLRHSNYILTATAVHEFWLCQDDDTELVCKLSCDGDTDLQCPAVGGGITITSNAR